MAGIQTFPPSIAPTYPSDQYFPPPPFVDQVCYHGHCTNLTLRRHEVLIEVTALTVMSSLVLTFFIIVTENRLWYSNKFLKLFLENMEQPLSWLLSSGVLLVMGFPYENELYILWAILLMVGSQSILCVMGYSLQNSSAMKLIYLQWLGYNIFNGFVIGLFVQDSVFRYPLWALWALTTLKLLQRFISLLVAENQYNTEKVNVIADHMKHEHEQSRESNPVSMQGYKYIVFGEEQVKTDDILPPDYQMRLDLKNPLIVTTDKLWEQTEGPLTPEFDPLGRTKDLCLSFALCKLLRRRFLNYPAVEAGQSKTRDFVFQGLLSGDKQRVFRVIKTELGFYKDLLFTKHPIIFSKGLPAYNFILTFLTMAFAGWIAKIAYHNYHIQDLDSDEEFNTTKSGKNIDLYITYIIVGMIIAMEVIEFSTYILSDWARVMFIRMYLNSPWVQYVPFLNSAFAVCGKTNLMQPLSNRLGQYSLLKNYKAAKQARLYRLTCSIYGAKPGDGLKKDRHITLPPQVKDAVFDSLQVNEDRLSNGSKSLFRNGVDEQLSWACNLPTDLHTIMVWHIATSYCEIIPSLSSQQGNETNKIVATSLSKYCAYLVVFAPDLLPGSGNAARFVFNKIILETRKFFAGKKTENQMYNTMKEVRDDKNMLGKDNMIFEGSKLGKKLEAMDVETRWKVLADFWAEFIVYLAPSNSVVTHLNQLQLGGEFLTHLWVLLYHAGIIDRPEEPHTHWSKATMTP